MYLMYCPVLVHHLRAPTRWCCGIGGLRLLHCSRVSLAHNLWPLLVSRQVLQFPRLNSSPTALRRFGARVAVQWGCLMAALLLLHSSDHAVFLQKESIGQTLWHCRGTGVVVMSSIIFLRKQMCIVFFLETEIF